jgi:hypothetical protein
MLIKSVIFKNLTFNLIIGEYKLYLLLVINIFPHDESRLIVF